MASRRDKLRYGQIVWATVKDLRGFRKVRPTIIVTPTEEIAADEPLVLVAITTTFADPPRPNCVMLPSHPDRRRVGTGLARRSAAVCDWLTTAYADEITDVIGRVPPAHMREIQRRIDSL